MKGAEVVRLWRPPVGPKCFVPFKNISVSWRSRKHLWLNEDEQIILFTSVYIDQNTFIYYTGHSRGDNSFQGNGFAENNVQSEDLWRYCASVTLTAACPCIVWLASGRRSALMSPVLWGRRHLARESKHCSGRPLFPVTERNSVSGGEKKRPIIPDKHGFRL